MIEECNLQCVPSGALYLDLLLAMRACRVLVVGDSMLDEFLLGSIYRSSPESGSPVILLEHESLAPGGAANAALGISALGASVTLVTVAGADHDASRLRAAVTSTGINNAIFVEDSTRPTTRKARVVALGTPVARLDREATHGVSDTIAAQILSAALTCIEACDALLLSDYAKGVLTPEIISSLIEAARIHGIPVVIDPKGPSFSRYTGATLITPNLSELSVACRRAISYSDVADAASAIIEQLGTDSALLVTLGAQGMTLFSEGRALHVPAHQCNEIDVTGAGDTVAAVMATALAADAHLEHAVILANLAGSLAVSRQGTNAVSYDDLASIVPSTIASALQT